jgi:hypothetical protein
MPTLSCLLTNNSLALGPLFAAEVIDRTGSVVPIFWIALGAHLFYIIFFLLFIPESLSKDKQFKAREKHRLERESYGPAADWINHLRSINIFEPLRILYPRGPGSNATLRRNLLLLSATDTIIFGVAMGSMTIVVLYINLAFGWTAADTSRFVSIANSSRVFGLVVVLPLVIWYFRGRHIRNRKNHNSTSTAYKHHGADTLDLSIVRIGILFDTLGYLGYTLARSGDIFIVAGAVAALGGVASPTIQSALTKHVPSDRVGQLLGAMGLLHALVSCISYMSEK